MARFFSIYAVGVSFGLFVHHPLCAKPEGFHLKAGHAVLSSQDASSLKIESRGNAIVEWDAFPLAASEAIHFEQADQDCAVLNRILSNSRSEIFGRISSNGSVFLINPHGILIGEEAKINTAGFLASSLDVLDADFLAGKAFLFSGNGEGSIVNCGTISCPEGHIVLLSRTQVENRGALLAPNGAVCLAVGSEILLQPEETPCILIRTQVAADEPQEGTSLLNTGAIQALAVELKSGSSAYAKAIQHEGIIEAVAVERRGGEIFLVAEKGICESSGKLLARNQEGNGGAVHLLGKCVGLLEGAEVDASGASGGGTILIGGDFQGKTASILNAQCTVVGKGVLLRADATQNGDGGKVIVWANKQTRYLGSTSARGGSQGGDGGFVEVSAPRLMFHGLVNAMAPFGKTGTLLLDPNDIVIDALATTGSFTACGPPATYTITGGTPTNQILNTDLEMQLAGCNVLISTVGSPGAGPNGGSITVSSVVGAAGAWSSANTLTLTANSFIVISAAITNTNMGGPFTAMNFTANGSAGSTHGISLTAALTTSDGNITLAGTSRAGASNGVNITGSGKITSGSGAIDVTGTAPVGVAGSVRGIFMSSSHPITSTTGTISLHGVSNGTANNSNGVMFTGVWTTGTSGLVTFSNCTGSGVGGFANYGVSLEAGFTTSGAVTFSNCSGGAGSQSAAGVNAAGALTATGNVTATMINSGTGNGSLGFHIGSSFTTSGNVDITATSQGVSTLAHGIQIVGSVITLGTGTITLNGTASASSTGSSNGVYFHPAFLGTARSDSGLISVTGSASGTGGNQGIRLEKANAITSTAGGGITLNGTSTSTGANSDGVAILASWATGTAGALSLTGAAPAGSFAIKLANNLTSNGDITFNSATGLSATVAVTGNGGALNTLTFSTLDAATAATQGLTVNGGTEVITFAGVVGGTARLSALTIPSGTECQVHANITANTVTISNPVPVSVSGDRIITATGS